MRIRFLLMTWGIPLTTDNEEVVRRLVHALYVMERDVAQGASKLIQRLNLACVAVHSNAVEHLATRDRKAA